jgi:ABC-type microcin C transport system permease subunit YejE
LILIIISLSIRAVGDFILAQPSSSSSSLGYIQSSSSQIVTYFLGLSGWFIVAAMLVFVVMIHKSMKEVGPLPRNNTNPF